MFFGGEIPYRASLYSAILNRLTERISITSRFHCMSPPFLLSKNQEMVPHLSSCKHPPTETFCAVSAWEECFDTIIIVTRHERSLCCTATFLDLKA